MIIGSIHITFYNKPELLHLYLEQLEKSNELSLYNIQLHTEIGYDPEEDIVINNFRNRNPTLDIEVIIKEKKGAITGFHNIVSSYLGVKGEFLVVGEEDILPTEDYLRFNRTCYEKYLKYPRIMGVAHKRRPEAELIGDPEILIGDYQCTSLSVISAATINKYIIPILTDDLFNDPVSYYMKHYRNSRINPMQHTHHDGFIERIMEKNKLFVLKPDQARSMHVGLSGIFCGGKPPSGRFEQRLAEWRELIKDGNRLRSLSNMPHDIVVTDPHGPKWDKLVLDPNRCLSKASSWWYDTNNDFKQYIEEQL
jgi:hypothetical protein